MDWCGRFWKSWKSVLAPIEEQLDGELAKRPKISGAKDQFLGSELRSVLSSAETEMSKLKDEYVSVEHFLLALVASQSIAGRILRTAGVTREKLMKALVGVRGSQRVTDQNPEGKYQTLEKYGRDLTESARRGQDRSGHRTGRGDSKSDAGAFPADQK